MRFLDRAPLRFLDDGEFYAAEKLGQYRSRSPEGYLLIRAVPVSRTGTQLYRAGEVPIEPGPDGVIRVERSPEAVFRAETLASGNGKAITIDHPPGDVTPENDRELAMGRAWNLRRGEGAFDDLTLADFVVTCPKTIAAIDAHELTEVSVGYDADYEEVEPGVGRQLNIVINHFALLGPGDSRCGPRCTIGDAAGDYQAAKRKRDELEAVLKDRSAVMNAFPRGKMNLIPDEVKATSEYRRAKNAVDAAFAELRRFNQQFVKTYAAEIRAERAARFGDASRDLLVVRAHRTTDPPRRVRRRTHFHLHVGA